VGSLRYGALATAPMANTPVQSRALSESPSSFASHSPTPPPGSLPPRGLSYGTTSEGTNSEAPTSGRFSEFTPTPLHRRGSVRASVLSRVNKRGSGLDLPVGERIATGVRLRPRLPHERAIDGGPCVRIEQPGRVVLIDPRDQSARAFSCDHVFDSSERVVEHHASQQTIYDAIGSDVVEQALTGYNWCLCAYGQTGTGKTHTVIGDWLSPERRGLLPRLAAGVLGAAEKLQRRGAEVSVRSSYVEIYKNRLHDLLTPAWGAPGSAPLLPGRSKERRLKIRTHPTVGVYVENLSEVVVECVGDVGKVVGQGQRARQTARTSMNDTSSRSHVIFSLHVEVCNSPDGSGNHMATLQVVDLAGRENEQTSECTGERLRELTFINRSLFYLANCIHALSNGGGDHVPFRNSKLTLLLSESFQRNSRTFLLATLMPNSSGYEENLLTCRFLESTGRIHTQPVANCYYSEDLRCQLEDEINNMRKVLGLSDAAASLPPSLVAGAGLGQDSADGVSTARLQARQVLLSRVRARWNPHQVDKKGTESAVQDPDVAREAVLRDACARAEQFLKRAGDGLAWLDEESSAISTHLKGTVESQLSTVEAAVQKLQVNGQPSLMSAEPKTLVSSKVVALPPLVPVCPKGDGKEVSSGRPTVTVTVALPPLVLL